MAQYTYNDFIKSNAAPASAAEIGVFDALGNMVGSIPLGSLQNPGEEPIYKFGLLSDIHLDTTDYNYNTYINTYPYSDEGEGDFRRALNWLKNQEHVDMVCACGDMSQNGTTSEFAMPQSVISEVLPNTGNIPFYTCTGNHDVKTAGGNGFGNYFLRSLETSWSGMTGFERSSAFNESFCFSKTAGDKTDHFIFFSMYSYSLGSGASPYDNADITWLQGKLNAWKNDRVFLFTHLFFPDYAGNLGRVNGSGGIYPSGNWLGGSQLTTLTGFLSSYPNVIWFSGHSHWKWDLQKYQKNLNVDRYGSDGAWTVHVPSCALPIDSNYTNLSSETDANRVEKPLESQGGVVYVYADRIEIRGIDFNINTSQNGDTTRGNEGTEYLRYLPIAHYNMSTILKTVAGSNDPVQGYYIATGTKTTGETITKEGDYIILTYNALSQCVVCTNGALSADDETNGATVTAEDIKVIYGGQEISLSDVQNYGIYMEAASDTGGGSYANLSDLLTTTGVTGASVQSFPSVDSNNQNSATRYGIQFNVSSRFITGNTWCSVLDSSNTLVVKIKGLRINGVLVNTQSGNIGGGESGEVITYEMVNIPYADINSMAVGDSKEVIMVNPHRSNGYILGHNGSTAVSEGNGFATEAAMKEAAYGVKDDNNYRMVISKKQDTRIDNVETEENVARTFALTGAFNNTNISSVSTPSFNGYDVYSMVNRMGVRRTSYTGSVTITFDGTVLPRTIYVYTYRSNTNLTATQKVGDTTILNGGTTTQTPTSISQFTAYSMTGNSVTINLAASASTNTTYYVNFFFALPNDITETVTSIKPTEVPDGDPYYTLTSKVGNMSPTGTTTSAEWSSTPMHYTIENATSLASTSDLTSGIAATNNPNLIRFKNPSNNYLNAGGALSALKFATGTGEWSAWYIYDANAGGASSSSDYLKKANFETNADKKSPDVNTTIQDLPDDYVAVTFNTTGQGYWVTPSNFTQDVQPTLVVEDLKVYSGTMTTSGTTIELPSYVGFFDDRNHTGTARYQIATGFQPSYVESGSNGRLQFQTSSSYAGGNITIVMKAKFTYA